MNDIMLNRSHVILLVLITPFLTELLSSNIPASLFFRPQVFLSLILIYGLPVLVIRDLACRWNLGLLGILCLGLAYGIFNEGVCAKTILMTENVPMPAFDGYDFLTFNIAWSTLIIPWHALHSVLYPILIVSFFYPQNIKKFWLSMPFLTAICLLFTLMGVWMFFNTPRFNAMPLYLPVFAALTAVMIAASRLLPKKPELQKASVQKASVFPAVLGFIFYLMYVPGLAILASKNLSTLILVIYAVLVSAIFYLILKFKKWLTIPDLTSFGFGDYCAVAFTAGLTGWFKKGSLEIAVTSILFMIIFVILILTVYLRKSKLNFTAEQSS
jgi:hypothetical protein